MARNFWDEMGQGRSRGMHGPMLDRLATELHATSAGTPGWESLALANLMAGLALNRHYAYQSLGALGVVELTAPDRARQVNAGLKRLGVPGVARQYFALHATLDVNHSQAWNEEVLAPIVADEPRAAPLIAEGAFQSAAETVKGGSCRVVSCGPARWLHVGTTCYHETCKTVKTQLWVGYECDGVA